MLVYCPPGPIHNFVDNSADIAIASNHDRRFQYESKIASNVGKLNLVLTEFNFHQRSEFSTYRVGDKLDLLFDYKRPEPALCVPSSCSNHFVNFI